MLLLIRAGQVIWLAAILFRGFTGYLKLDIRLTPIAPRPVPQLNLANADEAFNAILPIVKISLSGRVSLIGTGFFITNTGILVTARHVIQDNIGTDGRDLGAIGVFHTWGPIVGRYRPLHWSYWHPHSDIAICEVARLAKPSGEHYVDFVLGLSISAEPVGELVSSQFFHDASLKPDFSIENEKFNPRRGWNFRGDIIALPNGEGMPLEDGVPQSLSVSSRITQGAIVEHYPGGRDSVMIPFAAYSSTLPIYAGSSGGPLFNQRGEVFAINCTRMEGSDISFHAALPPILELSVKNTYWVGDLAPRSRTIREMAELGVLEISGL